MVGLVACVQPGCQRDLPDMVIAVVPARRAIWIRWRHAAVAVEVQRAMVGAKLRTHAVLAAVDRVAEIYRGAPARRGVETDRQTIRLLAARGLGADHHERTVGRD